MIEFKKNYTFFLISILIITGLIYFYRLGNESLSTDEYLSLYAAQQSSRSIISSHKEELNPNTMPPLYVFILHYWLKLFGAGEFAQRSLSALLGILSVFLLYRLTKLIFDTSTGLFCALFACFSFSWFEIFRQNRCYSLFVALTLFSFYLFFYLVKNKNSKYTLLFLTIVNILLSYTHYFAFFVIILETAFGVFEWRKDKKGLINILLMCLSVGIFYLPWYSNLIFDFKREPIINDRTPWVGIPQTIFDIFRIIFYDFHFIWSPILIIIYIPFIIRGIKKLNSKNFDYSKYISKYLIFIFLLPIAFFYLVLFTNRVRYYVPFMFPLLIFLSLGIQNLNPKTFFKKLIFLSAAVFIIHNNTMDFVDIYNSSAGEDWRRAAKLTKQIQQLHNNPNIFLFQTRYNPPVFAYYYWGNDLASNLISYIASENNYTRFNKESGIKEKLFLVGAMKGKPFFDLLDSFPDNSWIWVFRYHDQIFAEEFRAQNENRYFIHQMSLNKDLRPIDMFLLKRIITQR